MSEKTTPSQEILQKQHRRTQIVMAVLWGLATITAVIVSIFNPAEVALLALVAAAFTALISFSYPDDFAPADYLTLQNSKGNIALTVIIIGIAILMKLGVVSLLHGLMVMLGMLIGGAGAWIIIQRRHKTYEV